ncbi:alpha/beta hydrolase [Micrococcus sp. EYE_162]|nr:alpha/beta hydrolase [Micrococcus sp. EYE_212]MCK6172677.1 alpha/beta hydrolase [Micrococcus sp. EYE_162]
MRNGQSGAGPPATAPSPRSTRDVDVGGDRRRRAGGPVLPKDRVRHGREGLEETDAGWVPRFDVDVLETALWPVHARPRWEEWGQIGAPTLLISGENGYVPAGELDEMRRRRPDVRHVQVPGAGHDVHLEAPERVAELVRGFAA